MRAWLSKGFVVVFLAVVIACSAASGQKPKAHPQKHRSGGLGGGSYVPVVVTPPGGLAGFHGGRARRLTTNAYTFYWFPSSTGHHTGDINYWYGNHETGGKTKAWVGLVKPQGQIKNDPNDPDQPEDSPLIYDGLGVEGRTFELKWVKQPSPQGDDILVVVEVSDKPGAQDKHHNSFGAVEVIALDGTRGAGLRAYRRWQEEQREKRRGRHRK